MIGASLLFVGFAYWQVLWNHELFPVTFIEGEGVTPFKSSIEYLIVFLNALTTVVLLLRVRNPQAFDAASLLTAVTTMGLSEIFFTLYSSVGDSFNLWGHVYKLIAYLSLYRMNPVAEKLTNCKIENAVGREIHEVFRIVNEITRKRVELPLDKIVQQGGIYELADRTLLIARDGTELPIDDCAAPIRGDDGTVAGMVVVFRDVTERKRAESRQLLATIVLENISEGILVTDEKGTILSVNPAFSEITGYSEAEVIGTNPRILSSGRHKREFYRSMWEKLGTFGIWKGEIWDRRKNGEFSVPMEAEQAAKIILVSLSLPFYINGHEYFISGSIGISIYPEDGTDLESLIKNADSAMYRAKEQGNQACLYQSFMNEKTSERLQLETSLRKALQQEELLLYFQPQVDLQTGSEETGLDPRYLELELTESIMMLNSEWVIRTLNQLKEMGVHISLDDFGTGYSSLNYLRSLPSFIRNIATDSASLSIVKSVIHLAHSLNIKVIAEGVETEEQMDVSPPMAAEECAALWQTQTWIGTRNF